MSDGPRALAVRQGEEPKDKRFIVQFYVRCPICDKYWMAFYLMNEGEKLRDAMGEPLMFQVGVNPDGTPKEKRGTYVETSRWGHHALCGEDFARRSAIVVEKGVPGQRGSENSRPWDETDEKRMWGILKNQVERYKASAILIGPWRFRGELIDEQTEERRRIMGRGVVVTREWLKQLNLNWKGSF